MKDEQSMEYPGMRRKAYMGRRARICCLLLLVLFGACACVPGDGSTITISVSGVPVKAELATTPASRAKGLMYRQELPQDQGMLFVFPQARELAFWMKNTLIPLSIAYIAEDGKIISIKDMKPQDETAVHSDGLAIYALEVNQGFFKQHGIQVGDHVQIPDSLNLPTL